jgi:DNA-binding transcriptional MerR regulator
MQSFTIRDIENLTGIKAHTLRIWEQRYGFLKPKRKESLHRIYDNEDLKNILRITFLYQSGWKVSRIAALTPEQVIEEINRTRHTGGNYSYQVTRLIESAIDFNELGFVTVINEVTEGISFEKCMTEVCYPYLQKLGLLWSTNNIIPAQEHFSSYIIQNRVISETEKVSSNTSPPSIVLTAPQGEFHELPLLFINYLLRKRGWSTLYMGTNGTGEEIRQVAALPSVQYIYLHLSTNFTGMFIDDYLEELCRSFADKKLIASGEGIRSVQRAFTNLTLLLSDGEIYKFIDSIRA